MQVSADRIPEGNGNAACTYLLSSGLVLVASLRKRGNSALTVGFGFTPNQLSRADFACFAVRIDTQTSIHRR